MWPSKRVQNTALWRLTDPNADAGDPTLQGYATDISVNQGGTVHFKVSTPAASFQIDVYRLGYYGGLGARKVATIVPVTGKNQPACLTDRQL